MVQNSIYVIASIYNLTHTVFVDLYPYSMCFIYIGFLEKSCFKNDALRKSM